MKKKKLILMNLKKYLEQKNKKMGLSRRILLNPFDIIGNVKDVFIFKRKINIKLLKFLITYNKIDIINKKANEGKK